MRGLLDAELDPNEPDRDPANHDLLMRLLRGEVDGMPPPWAATPTTITPPPSWRYETDLYNRMMREGDETREASQARQAAAASPPAEEEDPEAAGDPNAFYGAGNINLRLQGDAIRRNRQRSPAAYPPDFDPRGHAGARAYAAMQYARPEDRRDTARRHGLDMQPYGDGNSRLTESGTGASYPLHPPQPHWGQVLSGAAQAARGVAGAAGGAGGAAVERVIRGRRGGAPGGDAGYAAGFAAGQAAADALIHQLLGVEDSRSVGEVLEDTGSDAAGSGVGTAIERRIERAQERAREWLRRRRR